MSFKDKVVLVTGGSRGIGKAIALHFAAQGANIVISYLRRMSEANKTIDQIENLGRKAIAVKGNLAEPEAIQRLFSEIEQKFGYLDIFIHNAASGYNRPVLEQRVKGWDWTMNINARSLLIAVQYAVPLMKKRGRGAIISISSPGAQRVLPDYSVVGASKAAIETLTRYLAVELASENIVVNAVSPGIVLTDALKHFSETRENDRIIEQIREATPAGRLVTPRDVAEVVAFLCSPQAEMIRGQIITIDGGFTLPAKGILP